MPLHGVQLRVAGAADNLQCIGGDALGHLACVPLHHGCFFVRAVAVVHQRAGVVHELPCSLHLAGHARELEPGFLKLGDRHVELHSLMRVGGGVFERAAGQAN